MPAATQLTIANQALGLLGASPLHAVDDETPNGERIGLVYRDQVRDFLLSLHRWVFAQGFGRLAELLDPPQLPLPRAYSPPADLVGTIHAFRDQEDLRACAVRTVQLGDVIYADCAPLWVEYTRAAPESAWPKFFQAAAVHLLASHLANGLQQQRRAAELRAQALGPDFDQGIHGGLLLLAKTEDGKSAPQRQAFGGTYESGDLVAARRGFDGWSGFFSGVNGGFFNRPAGS